MDHTGGHQRKMDHTCGNQGRINRTGRNPGRMNGIGGNQGRINRTGGNQSRINRTGGNQGQINHAGWNQGRMRGICRNQGKICKNTSVQYILPYPLMSPILSTNVFIEFVIQAYSKKVLYLVDFIPSYSYITGYSQCLPSQMHYVDHNLNSN